MSESAFSNRRFRGDDGSDIIVNMNRKLVSDAKNPSAAAKDVMGAINQVRDRQIADVNKAADKVEQFEHKIDSTGVLSELNPINALRQPKGKKRRSAIGRLALDILFPFAPIMRAIQRRKRNKKNVKHVKRFYKIVNGKKVYVNAPHNKGKRFVNPTAAREVSVYQNGIMDGSNNTF